VFVERFSSLHFGALRSLDEHLHVELFEREREISSVFFERFFSTIR
jgi:hypothetical protein